MQKKSKFLLNLCVSIKNIFTGIEQVVNSLFPINQLTGKNSHTYLYCSTVRPGCNVHGFV